MDGRHGLSVFRNADSACHKIYVNNLEKILTAGISWHWQDPRLSQKFSLLWKVRSARFTAWGRLVANLICVLAFFENQVNENNLLQFVDVCNCGALDK